MQMLFVRSSTVDLSLAWLRRPRCMILRSPLQSCICAAWKDGQGDEVPAVPGAIIE